MVNGDEVKWDSSQLCGSELLWSCCYPQSNGMLLVLQVGSLESSQESTPNPSVLSAHEGSGLNEDGELAGECGLRESCVAVCAPQC